MGPDGGVHRPFGEPLDLDAVVEELVAPRRGPPGRGPSHPVTPRTRWSSRAASATQGPAHDAIPSALARGVEGAHLGCIGEEGGRHARTGRERLVEVDDLEALVAQGADRAQLGGRVRGQRSHRAVGRRRHAAAERGHAGVRGRAVAGAEHPRLVAERTQRAGEPEHLALDATGDGQGVRTDRPRCAPPEASAGPQTTPEGRRSRRSRPIGRPVGLEEVPLLRGPADQVLEGVGQVLGHPLDVVAQPPLPGGVEGRHHDAAPQVRSVEVDGGGEDRCSRAQGERGGPAGERRALTEEGRPRGRCR